MSPRCTRTLIGGATVLGIGLFAALPSALSASAATTSGIPTIKAHHVLFQTGVHSGVTPGKAAASFGFTNYTASVKVGSKSYTYTIAGKNPAIKTSNPASTINAELVPLVMKFSNGDTWDPTKKDSCDSGASALSRVQNSPIVKNSSISFGGTNIGNVQVTNAYQRADFWKYAGPGGINTKFGVTLNFKTLKPVTIKVPNADAATGTISCGNGLIGAANINWLDPFLQKTVLPSLKSQGVSSSTFPVFVLHNFVEYVGTVSQCCVLGYHNDNGGQTYGVAMYDNSKFFGSQSQDISAMSHEVAEWQNDPSTVNPTPVWGHVGQVTGCQSNLEVGDPLSGTTYTIKLGGFTYHPQELAFFSWFYRQKPSLGVHGWYSDQGKFKSPSKPCS
jgi:hypothetical protein